MSDREDQQALVAAFEALADQLEQLVVVGGWAHRLHHLHEGVDRTATALYTQDLDLALKRPPREVTPPIDERLASRFEERLKGEGSGVTEYEWRGGGSTLTIEFLVARQANESSSGLDIGGPRAQRLRHLNVVFAAPWSCTLTREVGFPVSTPLVVNVANPAAFVVNKMLTYRRRVAPIERGKDLLYVFDTLRLFAPLPETLQRFWRDTQSRLTGAELRGLKTETSKLLDQQAIGEAASRIATGAGRPVSSERILKTCSIGLAEMFEKPDPR